MQHTINNTTVRNEFVALLKNLVSAQAALNTAKQQVQDFITKHKLSREQALPYVMTYCANRYGVPMYTDELRFVAPEGYALNATERAKLPKAKQTAIKSWMAAKDHLKNILKDAGLVSAKAKPAVVHKIDKVDVAYKAFAALSPAEAKRFLAMIAQ